MRAAGLLALAACSASPGGAGAGDGGRDGAGDAGARLPDAGRSGGSRDAGWIPDFAPDGYRPCGDGRCGRDEDCESCPADCGCDDGNDCTDDLCLQGGCESFPDDANACDDGLGCTVRDRCVAGACTGDADPCDDGNDCTDDLCLPGGQCRSFADDGNACDDGDPCTSYACRSGTCVGSPVPGCVPPADAGVAGDAAPASADAGTPDARGSRADAGAPDAPGPRADAGTPDAPGPRADAGAPDAPAVVADCCDAHADCDPAGSGRLCVDDGSPEGRACGAAGLVGACAPGGPGVQCSGAAACFRPGGGPGRCGYLRGTANLRACLDLEFTDDGGCASNDDCSGFQECGWNNFAGRNFCGGVSPDSPSRCTLDAQCAGSDDCVAGLCECDADTDCRGDNCTGSAGALRCVPGGCAAASQCPSGFRCVLITGRRDVVAVTEHNGGTGCVAEGAGTSALGAACASSAACRSGLCLGGRCTSLCRDSGDCPAVTACLLTALRAADFDGFASWYQGADAVAVTIANVCR